MGETKLTCWLLCVPLQLALLPFCTVYIRDSEPGDGPLGESVRKWQPGPPGTWHPPHCYTATALDVPFSRLHHVLRYLISCTKDQMAETGVP